MDENKECGDHDKNRAFFCVQSIERVDLGSVAMIHQKYRLSIVR